MENDKVKTIETEEEGLACWTMPISTDAALFSLFSHFFLLEKSLLRRLEREREVEKGTLRGGNSMHINKIDRKRWAVLVT